MSTRRLLFPTLAAVGVALIAVATVILTGGFSSASGPARDLVGSWRLVSVRDGSQAPVDVSGLRAGISFDGRRLQVSGVQFFNARYKIINANSIALSDLIGNASGFGFADGKPDAETLAAIRGSDALIESSHARITVTQYPETGAATLTAGDYTLTYVRTGPPPIQKPLAPTNPVTSDHTSSTPAPK